MKIKSSPQVSDYTGSTSSDIIRHIQAVTDDVRNILKGGLSFSDGQLPFQISTVNVQNNVPVILTIQYPFTIKGCIPIQTNGATISGFKTNNQNGVFTVTVTMDVTNASISFLTVGTQQ